MKKFLVSLIIILALGSNSFASIIAQTQVNSMGTGVGVGLSGPLIPMLLDFGIEANRAVSPIKVPQEGTYTDEVTNQKVEYEGTLSWQGTRYGVFLKFNLPFISPIIHAGTQEADISLDGDIRIPGQEASISEVSKLYGSYISIGLPFYIGPLFIEPSFGTQSIYVPHFTNIKSITEFQISCGLSIL